MRNLLIVLALMVAVVLLVSSGRDGDDELAGNPETTPSAPLPSYGNFPPDGFEYPPIESPAYDDITTNIDQARRSVRSANPSPVIYGVNFMSSAEYPATADRYQKAKSTGAQWNRWPLYWHTIEENANGVFDWSAHDAVVSADIQNGLLLNAILMGIPGGYFDNGRAVPNTLYEPIFNDGTDIPSDFNAINQNNKWARYVYEAVNRYKPGGVLAQQQGWAWGAGVTHWEMWNEPDLPWFWDGTKQEYARLLKVSYLAANEADPGAQVIFGSMANNYNDLDYYKDILEIYKNEDPRADIHEFYHNIMATHNYFYAWGTWYHVFRAKNAMNQIGIDKPIWLNETGLAAWNDYPGPVWDASSQYRGTMEEQANFTIQTTFYALFAGAEGIFHFQMWDGCGNQPQNTDFPPHNGELCRADGMLVSDPSKPCGGDANGLFRNQTDAACFRQHPQAGTARPNFYAYKTLTQYLQDVVPLARDKVCTVDGQSWISFYRPNTNQKIMALWACTGVAQRAAVPAIDNGGALLLTPDGNGQYIAPVGGYYYLDLPAATNTNPVNDPQRWPVGGRPYILVERDLQPPTVSINASQSGNNVYVSWNGNDQQGSGIAVYDVVVERDGAAPQTWLSNVTQTSATYTGGFSNGIKFTVRARDKGWNQSAPASTTIGSAAAPAVSPSAEMTVDRTLATTGDTLTYNILVSNPSATTGNPAVHLVNTLPDWLDFRPNSLASTGGYASFSNGVVRWDGGLAPSQTVSISYQVVVRGDVPYNITVRNEAVINDDSNHWLTRSATTSIQLPTSMPPPTNTPWSSPTPTLASGIGPNVTATFTPQPTWTRAPTNTPQPSNTPVPSWTPSPAWTPSPTKTPQPTWTQSPTNTPAPSQTPSATATTQPSVTPSPTTAFVISVQKVFLPIIER